MKKIFKKLKDSKFSTDLIVKAIAELSTMVFSLISFAIIIRLISKQSYAVVNQTVLLGGLLSPILLFKFNSAFCIFLPSEKNKEIIFSRYKSVQTLLIPICIIFSLILIIFRNGMSTLLFATSDYSHQVILVGIYISLLTLSVFSIDFFRSIEKIKLCSIFVIIRALLILIAILLSLAAHIKITLNYILLIYCVVEFITAIISYIAILINFKGVKAGISYKPLKEYFIYAFPLMPYMVMAWANNNIGKFILNHLLNLEQSAIYSFYFATVNHIFFLQTVIGYTIFPYISKFWNEKRKDLVLNYLNKGLNIIFVFITPLIFGLIITAPTIVNILAGSKYEVDINLIAILSVGFLALTIYSLFAFLIDLTRKTIIYNLILLISAGISIALNFLLIPRIGIYGAAFAFTIASIVQAIVTVILSTRTAKFDFRIRYKFIMVVFLCGAIMALVAKLIYNNSGILNFLITVTAAGIIYIGLICIVLYLNKKYRQAHKSLEG